jgi:ribosomal protein S18 acetylase RimI-like enzyme
MVIIHEDYRRRGIGTALTTHALNYLRNKGAQTIRLDATPEGYNIYRKLGFSDEFPVYHYVKEVASDDPPLRKILEAEPMGAADLEAIIEFDKLLLGLSRAKILKALFNDSRAFVLRRSNETHGYLMCRGTTRLHWLGPFVADDVPSAERLLQKVLIEFSDREIRLGVPGINSSAIKLFRRYGFRAEFEITRMRYGLNLVGENTQSIFAEAGHEKT